MGDARPQERGIRIPRTVGYVRQDPPGVFSSGPITSADIDLGTGFHIINSVADLPTPVANQIILSFRPYVANKSGAGRWYRAQSMTVGISILS